MLCGGRAATGITKLSCFMYNRVRWYVIFYIQPSALEFIYYSPENPWSLDRGMNGVKLPQPEAFVMF